MSISLNETKDSIKTILKETIIVFCFTFQTNRAAIEKKNPKEHIKVKSLPPALGDTGTLNGSSTLKLEGHNKDLNKESTILLRFLKAKNTTEKKHTKLPKSAMLSKIIHKKLNVKN